MVIIWLMMVNYQNWLVVAANPSEKWWTSSVGMMKFPWNDEKCIKMFQSPPTRRLSMVIDSTNDSWRRGTRGTTQGGPAKMGGLGDDKRLPKRCQTEMPHRPQNKENRLHPHPCSPDVVEFNPTLLQNQENTQIPFKTHQKPSWCWVSHPTPLNPSL